MPEAIAEPPVAPPVQPSPVQEAATGSQSFVDEMVSGIASSPKPAESAPKEPGPTPPTKPAPEPSKSPVPPPAPVKEKDPVSLRKRLAEIEQEYSGYKLNARQEQEKLAKKISEFEKRKYLTPEQEEAYSRAEQRAKQLEAELYARDYRESPEFKDAYEGKWQRAYANAVDETTAIQVTDAEGNVRMATQADFNRVLQAPKGQQWIIAKELFGDAAQAVLAHRTNLKQIESDAGEVLMKQRATFEQQKKESALNSQKMGERFTQAHAGVDSSLEQKYPEYFAQDPTDTEANEAQKLGLSLVDDSLKAAENLSVEDRAARSALIRRWAGSFPRMVHVNRKLKAELESAQKTIAKLKGSDPGEGGETTPSGKSGKSDDGGGVDALIKEFEMP